MTEDGVGLLSPALGRRSPVIHSWNCPPDVRGFPIEMRPLRRVHSGREMEGRSWSSVPCPRSAAHT